MKVLKMVGGEGKDIEEAVEQKFEIPEELRSNILEAMDLMVIDEKNDTFYSAPDVETARKWQQELDIGNRGLKIIK